MSFTMRDSSADFINVTCWGGEQYIMDLAQQFHIADIGEYVLTHSLGHSLTNPLTLLD